MPPSSLHFAFLILALVCFLIAALGITWRGNFIGAGLFFLTLALLVV